MVGFVRRLHFDVTDIKKLFPKTNRELASLRLRRHHTTDAE